MQQKISSREFTEWIAYYQLEPFGEERADLRMGIIASLIANSNRDPKKRKKPFEPKDFMPLFEAPNRPWQDQLQFVKLINKAMKAVDEAGKTEASKHEHTGDDGRQAGG